jgi:hypothetical protein
VKLGTNGSAPGQMISGRSQQTKTQNGNGYPVPQKISVNRIVDTDAAVVPDF